MRCSEIARDLDATPDGRPESAEVAAHLASCPACSALAERNRRLAQLWEATRPGAPTEAAWDVAWARISREVTASGGHAGAPPALPVRRVRPAWIGVALASAAALLAAFVLRPPIEESVEAGPLVGEVEALPGQVLLYSVDRDAVIAGQEPGRFDDFLAFYGHFETLDRGDPIDWFVKVEPQETVVYHVDSDTYTVVEREPSGVDDGFWASPGDEFLTLFNHAEGGFRSWNLAFNGAPGPGGH